MTIKVNQIAIRKAKSFINTGKIDATSSWSFSAADGNKLLGPDGTDWAEYAAYHLAEDTGANENTKSRYKYPWGKNDKIYRRGVIAIKARASAEGEKAIADAADTLLQLIDKKLGKEDSDYNIIKGDIIQGHHRIDQIEFDAPEYYMEESFQKTPEGFLKGRAIFTNIGVFPYLLEDGTIRWELRPPSEVFQFDSVKSFQLLPLTNDHPSGFVTTANIKDVQVGYTGEDIKTNAYYLSIPIVVTDEETIDACTKKGKRALSAGYTVDLEMTSGVWMGVPYDAIQRNIRGNHVAVVDRARAGDDAVMKFDSASNLGILQDIAEPEKYIENNNNERRDSSMLKKKVIDGVEYEADQKIIDLLSDSNKENEKLKLDSAEVLKANSILLAERDQLREENEKLKADIAKSREGSPEEFEKAVQQRLVVLDAARRAQIEIIDGMTEDDIKKAVIVTVCPNAKEKLDSCNKEYLQARFDGALEILDNLATNKDNHELKGDSIANTAIKRETDTVDSVSAYNRMVKNMQDASKRKEVN